MKKSTIDELITLMAALRDPQGGCPWDREQTLASLVPYTLEEAYEVADCIERDDLAALPGELGDLLFQVVFYAQICMEQGQFTFTDVVTAICEKLTRRHPHVFGEDKDRNIDAREQSERWEAMKIKERLARAKQTTGRFVSALDDVPMNLPALSRAEKLQRRAARTGFDWPSMAGVMEKLHEELAEMDEAIGSSSHSAIEDEIGDVLFSCVNVARFLDIDPETALRRANRKFESRYQHIEASLNESGRKIEQMSLSELETLWQAAKRKEKKRAPKHP